MSKFNKKELEDDEVSTGVESNDKLDPKNGAKKAKHAHHESLNIIEKNLGASQNLNYQFSGQIENKKENELKGIYEEDRSQNKYNYKQKLNLSHVEHLEREKCLKILKEKASTEELLDLVRHFEQKGQLPLNHLSKIEEVKQDSALKVEEIDRLEKGIQVVDHQGKAHQDIQTEQEIVVEEGMQTLQIHKSDQECQTVENPQVHQSVQTIQKDKGDSAMQTERVLKKEQEVQTYT